MAIIDDIYVQAFPFPCLLLGEDGSLTPVGGALFPAPPGTACEEQIHFYSLCKPGWHVCPIGYAVYCFILNLERATRLIVFGLKVHGVSTVHGKLDVLSIKLSRTDIERFVRNSASIISDIEARLQNIVSSGVHEFRNVNKDFYNTAYRLEQDIANSGFSRSYQDAAKSIVELSEMMKSRSDIFDVITNPSIAQIRDQNVPVYRAFDRARRSITTSSSARGLSLRMSGSSNARARAVQMFDVVPYIIIQNAVKYSPDHEEFIITVTEDGEFI